MRLQRKFSKGLRLQIYAWSALVGIVMLVGVTFAWYSTREREAETETGTVMKPYYLTLLNPSESATLQLSVGSLQQEQTKQIVFCVSNKDENAGDRAASAFAYSLELIHTDNLALDYEIYPLEKTTEADAGTGGIIVAEDVVEDSATVEADEQTVITYWLKKAVDGTAKPLTGIDVSEVRWEQAGLTDANAEESADKALATDIINRGTYIAYDSVVDKGDGTGSVDNGLKLEPAENVAYASQYFVLEISWKNTVKDFSMYDKETDMIYILAKAVQPKPEESTESP